MAAIPTIPRAVAEKLGHYVYVYVNPLDGRVVYVGKGKGARALSHLKSSERRKLQQFIEEIRASGAEPWSQP